jgi:hypothetical protein
MARHLLYNTISPGKFQSFHKFESFYRATIIFAVRLFKQIVKDRFWSTDPVVLGTFERSKPERLALILPEELIELGASRSGDHALTETFEATAVIGLRNFGPGYG